MEGSLGTDDLDGGGGTDNAWYLNAETAVDVNLTLGTATGGNGNDELKEMEDISGGEGGDTLTGDGGPNVLVGGLGDDHLIGLAGKDHLSGGNGVDTLEGGADKDTLVGGPESDFADGGSGRDTCFSIAPNLQNRTSCELP